jgi:tryptophan halogenase
VGNGMVFSSRYREDEDVKQALLANLQGAVLTQPRVIKFTPGQRHETWRGNCVAIGLSSGFLEPLESTSIHLIQRGIVRLMQLFPSRGICQADVEEYNRQSRSEIEHIRDFIIMHYKVTNRRDTPYWNACREMEIPASLKHRIELFRETGRVFRIPNELFAENSWIQVMLGQGIMPKQYHQVADLMGDAELSRFLNGIRSTVEKTVSQLPPHQSYVEKYCGTAKI